MNKMAQPTDKLPIKLLFREQIAAVAATFQLNNVVTLAQFDEKCSDIIDYIQQERVNAIYHPNTQ